MSPPAEKPSRTFARVSDIHTQGNRRSRDDWELYRQHRERLTETIDRIGGGLLGGETQAGGEPAGGRLCLLGAGNCNDVDLVTLARRFQTIHLVDIDGAALDRARARQPSEVRSRLVLHAGVDLTGLLAALERWKGEEPDLATLDRATVDGARAVIAGLPVGQCDLAVSCCLMSQLGWSLEAAADEVRKREGKDKGKSDALARSRANAPMVPVEIRLVMLTIHLRTLAALVRPGGAALLASDITSSDLYPLDELDPEISLRTLADELVAGQQVVYAGANPVLTSRMLRKDPVLKEAFSAPVIHDPWLWTGQFERTYLVYPQQLPRK